MEIVCIETEALKQLVDELINYIKSEHINEPKWLGTEDAMKLLNIKSKTTLQNLRDLGLIRFTNVASRKIILYDRESIMEYLESNAKDTF